MPFDDKLREAFLAIASHGSIGRAAEAMNVSQPTLSRIIKRLEQQLQVPLFDRYASGVALTAYGEALLPFANRIRMDSRHAQEEIDRLRSGSHGVLRIGSTVSPGITMLMPRVFERLHAESPTLQIELMEGGIDALETALLDRTIDIVIGELAPNDEILELNFSFEDTGSVIASPDHPVRERGPLTMADLNDVPWVMQPRGTQPRRAFERVLSVLGMRPPHVTVETRSVPMMMALVAESGFLSWLPRPVYHYEERFGLIAPVEVAGMFVKRRSHIYRRRFGAVPEVTRRFLEVMRQVHG
jgi:DNA-binding transcriptional LysR family regulator